MNLQDIRTLISEGNTDGAIKAFIDLVQAGEWQNRQIRDDLLILSGQFEELERKENIGIIDQEDSTLQRARVNHALLKLVDQFEVVKIKSYTPAATGPLSKQSPTLWLIIAAIAVAIGGAVIWYLPPTEQSGKGKSAGEPPALIPQASFDWNCTPGNCQAPCTVFFRNTSENADQYRWYLDEHEASNNKDWEKTFGRGGNYVVKLVAQKGAQKDTVLKTVTIISPPPPASVKASFHANKKECTAPCSIVFTNDSQNAETYQWNLDGNNRGNTKNITLSFNAPGEYTVQLIAKKGAFSDRHSAAIRILPPPPPPEKSPALKELVFRLKLYTDLLDQHETTMNNEHALQLDSWYKGWYTNSDKNFEGKGILFLISLVKDEKPNVSWDALERSLKFIDTAVQQRTGGRHFGGVQTMDYQGLVRSNAVIKRVLREIG